MGATWFDNLRGVAQGRLEPTIVTPPDGEHVFVLGGEGIGEASVLSPGDHTEVRQIVDLTDIDLVLATMDTIGKVAGEYQPPIGWGADVDDLWHFNYDLYQTGGTNLVSGGFDLAGQADIEIGQESYSPQQTNCRVIPVNNTGAFLLGANNPIWNPSPGGLDKYTFQFWMNLDVASIATSWGWNIVIFEDDDIVGGEGIEIHLDGVAGPGAKEWVFSVFHRRGGSTESTVIPGYVVDSSVIGWHMYTIVWDQSKAAWQNKLKLYVDNNPVPYPPFGGFLLTGPGPTTLNNPIAIASTEMWGSVDEMRMLLRPFTPADIAAAYTASITYSAKIAMKWVMQILIDNTVFAERTVSPTEARRWTDFKAPVRRQINEHEVTFRLELQET